MSKYIARVFVPMYLELEADSAEDAKEVAEQWYREQRKDWKEATVEVVPVQAEQPAL